MAIVALQYPVFKPAMRVIDDIVRGETTTITTTFAHGYITGTIVRIYVPTGFGIPQMDKMQGPIVVTSDTEFIMAINSSDFDPYETPTSFPLDRQYSQVVPIGEVNETLLAALKNVLPYSAT